MDARDLFAYTLLLRRRLLDALRDTPQELLERDLGTNHRSILGTLAHIVAIEESWVAEDLRGEPPKDWEEFRARYFPEPTLQALIDGWERVSAGTIRAVQAEGDLGRTIEIPAASGATRRITVAQVLLHVAGEELIHMGEVLAMTRQLGIDLPAYYLLSAMASPESPWAALTGNNPA